VGESKDIFLKERNKRGCGGGQEGKTLNVRLMVALSSRWESSSLSQDPLVTGGDWSGASLGF
jgi:hypothetical protein